MARIKPQALLQQSKKKKGPSGISAITIAIYCLIVFGMIFLLFIAYRRWSGRSELQTDVLSGVEHNNSFAHSKKIDIPKYAVIDTSKGSITVELYRESSPEVDEFIDSCRKGRFKGMPFNRVIKNFVIQGGDVSPEDWTLQAKHYNQLDTSLKHEAFMLGTSKTKQGRGFLLLITTAPIPELNDKISIFGHVIKGEDVIREIENAETDEHYQPKTPLEITEITLKQKL